MPVAPQISAGPNTADDVNPPMIPTLDHTLDLADNLFPMPKCVIDARQAITNGASASKIATLIGQDQILATAIVRLANTAAFRGKSPIRELSQAVARVGTNQLDQCLLALGVMPRGKQNSVVTRLTPRLLSVAAACRVLASYQTTVEMGTAFMTGLFLDMGQVLLAHGWPKEYGAMLFESPHAKTLSGDVVEEEQDWLGFSHVDVGVRLAKQWNLADVVVEGVQYSHDLIAAMSNGGANATVTAAIMGLATRIGRGIHSEIDSSCLSAESIVNSNENAVLELSEEGIDALVDEVRIEAFALGAVFHSS